MANGSLHIIFINSFNPKESLSLTIQSSQVYTQNISSTYKNN